MHSTVPGSTPLYFTLMVACKLENAVCLSASLFSAFYYVLQAAICSR